MRVGDSSDSRVVISIIVPIYNGELWIDNCFENIIQQTVLNYENIKIELSVFNDGSSDRTSEILEKWNPILEEKNILFTLTENLSHTPKGVGYAKNSAVKSCCGEYLCFQDVDDIMLPDRVIKQYELSKSNKNSIIGCCFKRDPENSTARFTKWANNLNNHQLNNQIYTSNGPTVIMPTWFLHKSIFERVGGFSEDATGTPEDLIFFYDHIDKGGTILRVDDCLLIYRYIPNSATFSILSQTIWDIKLQHFIKTYLSKWCNGFTIWNAGKQGRLFVKSLNENQRKFIKAMCDVNVKKIGQHYEYYCPKKRKPVCRIPIVHFKDAKPPFVICMKLDLTNGEFEQNLSSLNLIEGKDFVIFN